MSLRCAKTETFVLKRKVLNSPVMDAAQISAKVRAKLDAERLNANALVRRLKGEVSQSSIYDFLKGKNVELATLLAICEAMRLEVVVNDKIPPNAFTERFKPFPPLKSEWAAYERARDQSRGGGDGKTTNAR